MSVEVRWGRSMGRDSPTGGWKRQEYGTVQDPGRDRRLAGTGSSDGGGDRSMRGQLGMALGGVRTRGGAGA